MMATNCLNSDEHVIGLGPCLCHTLIYVQFNCVFKYLFGSCVFARRIRLPNVNGRLNTVGPPNGIRINYYFNWSKMQEMPLSMYSYG